MKNQSFDQLQHFGVEGMKWGVRKEYKHKDRKLIAIDKDMDNLVFTGNKIVSESMQKTARIAAKAVKHSIFISKGGTLMHKELDDIIQHFGVKGMKWGVRRKRSPEQIQKSIEKTAKRTLKEQKRAEFMKEFQKGLGTSLATAGFGPVQARPTTPKSMLKKSGALRTRYSKQIHAEISKRVNKDDRFNNDVKDITNKLTRNYERMNPGKALSKRKKNEIFAQAYTAVINDRLAKDPWSKSESDNREIRLAYKKRFNGGIAFKPVTQPIKKR